MARVVILLMTVPVCVAGFGANAINLAVFWRQGSWIIYGLSLNSCCTAVFISVERCLCITQPFKVKEIITPGRSIFIIASIFTVSMATVFPSLSLVSFVTQRDPCTNVIPRYMMFVHSISVRPVRFIVSNILFTSLQIISFICLLLCTGTLILSLRNETKWRNRVTYRPCAVTLANTAEPSLSREKRVVKMVVIVASVFIVCFAPAQAAPIANLLMPEFFHGRRYGYAYGVCWAVSYFLYSVNSSVNLIVYYNMSSRYRDSLGRLIRQYLSCLHTR
ncbi:neuropeptides capa receptor-like [Aplysia californica]|uniref:Neuropeptides capa receptor-like n=1 Tax=Aplysia californica TaxID=6500 RepID=A0ABM0JI97_APLCA|nr:neuropeptides capa receptor-like [Aplysia californica]